MNNAMICIFVPYFQAFSLNRTLRPKRKPSVGKESPSAAHDHSSELLSRLAMLEEQVRMMGDQLNKVNGVKVAKLK